MTEYNFLINTTKTLMVGVYGDLNTAYKAMPRDRDNYYICDCEILLKSESISLYELKKLVKQIDLELSPAVLKSRSVVVERLTAAWKEYPMNKRLRKGTDYGKRGA